MRAHRRHRDDDLGARPELDAQLVHEHRIAPARRRRQVAPVEHDAARAERAQRHAQADGQPPPQRPVGEQFAGQVLRVGEHRHEPRAALREAGRERIGGVVGEAPLRLQREPRRREQPDRREMRRQRPERRRRRMRGRQREHDRRAVGPRRRAARRTRWPRRRRAVAQSAVRSSASAPSGTRRECHLAGCKRPTQHGRPPAPTRRSPARAARTAGGA